MRTKAQEIAGFVACAPCLWGDWAATAYGQAKYPTRPIRVIVPFAPGGGSDVRALRGPAALRPARPAGGLGNRPAASGIVGADLVAKAAPDGYAPLLVFSTRAQSAQLFSKLPFDPIKDFAPITLVISTPLGMLLHPAVPAKTAKEFIAYVKANPGKLYYGSSGPSRRSSGPRRRSGGRSARSSASSWTSVQLDQESDEKW